MQRSACALIHEERGKYMNMPSGTQYASNRLASDSSGQRHPHSPPTIAGVRFSVAIALVGCVFASACRSEMITQSVPTENRIPEAGTPVKPIIDKANCGVVIASQSGVRTGVLKRDGINLPLPSILAHSELSNARTSLRFQRFLLRSSINGESANITLACLLPYDATYEQKFADVIQEYGPRLPWARVKEPLQKS